jgi:hypothetical protein
MEPHSPADQYNIKILIFFTHKFPLTKTNKRPTMDINLTPAIGTTSLKSIDHTNSIDTDTFKSTQNSEALHTECFSHNVHIPAALRGPDSAVRPTGATGRPEGDRRTAEDIINANPTLKNLNLEPTIYKNEAIERPLTNSYLNGIYKHTGDWSESNTNPESRADAAYNAARLFNFIDSPDAHTVRFGQHNDGFLSGLLPSNRTEKHSEHALLSEFIEKGYSSLIYKGEQQVLKAPTYPTGRPRGDNRTAEELINDNKKTFEKIEFFFNKNAHIRDNDLTFNNLVGDWSVHNRDPESRADALYDIITAFNYVESLKGGENINITSENPLGDVTPGTRYGGYRTKADMFSSFFHIGYQAFRSVL